VSFLPALRGQQGQLREATVHHSINGSFAIRSGKWKLCLCPGSGGWSSPKPAAAFKSGGPLVQLFDLDQDLGETNNLADKKPEVVTRMSDLLARYVARGRSTPGVAQKNQGKTPFLPKGYAGSKPAKRGQRRDK
jgi:arylsulfatase A-like enzyme